jgi:WD40 repeat protein
MGVEEAPVMWIRCPECDVAFQVEDESPLAEVRCGACGTLLGIVGDGATHIDQPLDIELVATLEGHAGGVSAIAFSPDGKSLASGSMDKTVRLWNLETGELTATLEGHSKGVRAVTFSPDGRTLASGSQEDAVRLWDVATLTERFAIARGYVDSSLAFTPDSQLLVTGGADDTVRIWEVESAQAMPLLHVGRNSVHNVAFSPDGRTLALGHLVSFGIALQVWDWDARRVRFAFQGPRDVTSVAFTPDGAILASADRAGQVMLWDPVAGEEQATLTPLGRTQYFRPRSVSSIAFSPNGSFLAMGLNLQGGCNVQVWDVAARQARAALLAHRQDVRSVAFSPDGSMLATASVDKTIRLWRLPHSKAQ